MLLGYIKEIKETFPLGSFIRAEEKEHKDEVGFGLRFSGLHCSSFVIFSLSL